MKINKKKVLTLIFTITVLGLLLIEPSTAPVTVPANPKPAPEIVSITIHNNPIWEPPVTITDSYTGDVTHSSPGYYTCNGSIDITLKNRPFTVYIDKNGNYIGRYYTFFYKDANTQWSENFPRSLEPYAEYQSVSTNTVVTFKYGKAGDISYAKENMAIDFRIQAVEGHYSSRYEAIEYPSGIPWRRTYPAVYDGIGSKYAEFSIKIPPSNKPGTSKLDIQVSTITPSKTNDNTQTTPETIEPSQTALTDPFPTTQNQNNSPLPNLLQSYRAIIFVTICIVIIPIVIVAYLNKQQKANPKFTDQNIRPQEHNTLSLQKQNITVLLHTYQ